MLALVMFPLAVNAASKGKEIDANVEEALAEKFAGRITSRKAHAERAVG